MLDYLIETIEDHPDKHYRKAAAGAFESFGNSGAKGVPQLIKALLYDQDIYVRRVSVSALEKMTTKKKMVVPALLKLLDDGDKFVKERAIKGLGNMGVEAQGALPKIKKILIGAKKYSSLYVTSTKAVKKIEEAVVTK